LEQNEPFTTLKTMISRKYSFRKQTPVSQGNNVLDASASNIDAFLWRDTCVSSTQRNRPIGSKQMYLHFETPKLQEEFLSKLTQFLQVKNVLDSPASNTDFFF
jgi:hypothetical protein